MSIGVPSTKQVAPAQIYETLECWH